MGDSRQQTAAGDRETKGSTPMNPIGSGLSARAVEEARIAQVLGVTPAARSMITGRNLESLGGQDSDCLTSPLYGINFDLPLDPLANPQNQTLCYTTPPPLPQSRSVAT